MPEMKEANTVKPDNSPQPLVQQQHGIQGLHIRQETPEDHHRTEALVREAFWNRYAPGCDEHYLVHLLRKAPGFAPWHSLVAEYEGQLIGQVLLSPAHVRQADGTEVPVLMLGPVGVLPAACHRGVGSALMHAAIAQATRQGERAIFLMGDPAYYHRFGFGPATAQGINLPQMTQEDTASHPYFMVLPLSPGALVGVHGTLVESPVFGLLADGLAAYDSAFPPREKLRLPGQLR